MSSLISCGVNSLPPLDFAIHGPGDDSEEEALAEVLDLEGSFSTLIDRPSGARRFGGSLVLDTGSGRRGARTFGSDGVGPSGPDEVSSSISGRGRRETCFIHRSRHDCDVCRLFLQHD